MDFDRIHLLKPYERAWHFSMHGCNQDFTNMGIELERNLLTWFG